MSLVDVGIVGGGPAGLSAALWLGRYLRTVTLVDSGDPRNWETRGVNGFLGLPHVRPAELRERGREEARRYSGVTLLDDRVLGVARVDDNCFHLQLASGGRVEARRLLLAYGLRDVWPRIEGLPQHYGDTAHVCPDCDGYESRDSRIVVVGTGRRAAGMALKLSNWSPDVTICTNGEPAGIERDVLEKLQALNIRVIETRVLALRAREESLRSLEFIDGTRIGCQHLFFSLGQRPADDIAHTLGCRRDERDQIVVDAHRHTSVMNVWAAGDLIPGPQLAISAAADGAIAALSIHKSLVPAQRRLD